MSLIFSELPDTCKFCQLPEPSNFLSFLSHMSFALEEVVSQLTLENISQKMT